MSKHLKVLQYVWINNQHVLALTSSLRNEEVFAAKSKPRIKKIALMVLFGPLNPVIYRILGFQIIHIHWTAGQFRPPRPKGALANKFFYLWFKFFLRMVKICRLKLIWTAHNFLPHEPVFNDDNAARRLLAKYCDAVIALNQENFDAIARAFSPKKLVLIEAAEPALVPSDSRQEVRNSLKVGEDQLNFAALGHVRPYKGADIFLESLIQMQSKSFFVVAGAPGSEEFAAKIQGLANRVIESGKQLNLQLDFLSDAQLGNLMLATDFLVCPFRQISNSGFVNQAMEMGVPMLLPDLPSLNWVPRNAAIWFDANNPVPALAQAIERAEQLTTAERDEMKAAGTNFMKNRNWSSYVAAHISLYKSILRN